MTSRTIVAPQRRRWLSQDTRHTINGLLFASPWLFGLLAFWIYPTLASAYYSFTKFNAVQPPVWIGFANYIQMLTNDTDVRDAIYNTLYFAIISIPLAVILAFSLALMMNAKVKGQVVYRTIYFLPTLVPEVALAFVWIYLFTPGSGLVNIPFQWLGIYRLCWLTCPQMARQTLILLALWIIGQQVILYLAGLQDIPQDLYDAADVDGAGFFRRLWHVVIPLMTPVIFFHLVTSIIGALQFFTIPYIMTGGTGFPANSTLFYSIDLYKQAFQYFNMGYASAMAWLLFVTTLIITGMVFRSSRLWVFYGGGE
jgi:multiple sugar transport system permease protein